MHYYVKCTILHHSRLFSCVLHPLVLSGEFLKLGRVLRLVKIPSDNLLQNNALDKVLINAIYNRLRKKLPFLLCL